VNEERLQKVLARAGLASRRAAEELIREGRVRVNGKLVRELGTKVDPRARVEVDGERVIAERFVYIVLHKPRGVVSTLRDPEGRPTVSELVKDVGVRVVPVGRLDYHTSGALLLTNDGEFAERLMHPKGHVAKEYVAKVRGVVDEAALERWRQSIVIDGRATQPAQVTVIRVEGDKTWLSIVLFEGRNRQVRRLGDATGFPVLRLARLAHAGITTEKLRPGDWRQLTMDELVDMKRTYGVPRRVRPPQPIEPRRRAAPHARPEAKRARGGEARPFVKKTKPARTDAKSARSDARPGRREAARAPRAAGRGTRPGRPSR